MSNITFLGDIAFNGLISENPEFNLLRFSKIAPILENSDIVFANLEVPLKVDNCRNENKNFIRFSLPSPTAELLKMLNIRCVSLANNHIFDCKMSGLKATIKTLDQLKIFHTGAGWLPHHIEPVIIEHNNNKVAFCAYVDKSTNPKTEYFPELFINYFNLKNVLKDIERIKDQVNNIICSIHWGNDYSNYYTNVQQEFAYKLIDVGVDVIMGHHPHTIQTFENYKGKYIFYSLGNLCFGDFIWEGKLKALRRKTKFGMIVTFFDSFSKIKIIPTIEKKGNYLLIPKININKILNRFRLINKLKNKFWPINLMIIIKESFFDRIIEFIFGYYRNPLLELISSKNIKKIKFMFRDFKSRYNK